MVHRRAAGRCLLRLAVALSVVVALWSCTPEVPADDDAGATEQASADTEPAEDGGAADPGPAEPAVQVPSLHPAIDALPATTVTLDTDGARVEVAAKVAADDPSRRRGLMEVEELPDGVGMLFVFDAARTSGFWMWNTRIPLDIAFAAGDGTVHTIATMVPCEASEPADCPITAPELPYVAALEVPAGWFARAGVETGAVLTWTEPGHPRP